LAVHSAGELHAAAAVLLLNQAPDGLAAYWEITDTAPDELFVRAMLMTAPPRRSCPNRYGGSRCSCWLAPGSATRPTRQPGCASSPP